MQRICNIDYFGKNTTLYKITKLAHLGVSTFSGAIIASSSAWLISSWITSSTLAFFVTWHLLWIYNYVVKHSNLFLLPFVLFWGTCILCAEKFYLCLWYDLQQQYIMNGGFWLEDYRSILPNWDSPLKRLRASRITHTELLLLALVGSTFRLFLPSFRFFPLWINLKHGYIFCW